MPHRNDVGLASAAAHGSHRKVDTVSAALKSREIARNTVTSRLVRVELNVDLIAKKLTSELHRVVNGRGSRRTRSILKANAIERNTCVHDEFKTVAIELGSVGTLIVDSRRKTHHRNDDFVVKTGVMNALTGPLEVVDVVQSVEVADRAHAVLLEHIGVELDHIGGLALKTNDVNAARESLEVGFRSGLAESVHNIERIFLAVEVAALEARTAARFKPPYAGVISLFNARKEVLRKNARADNTLEAVTKRCEHVLNCFFSHFFIPLFFKFR